MGKQLEILLIGIDHSIILIGRSIWLSPRCLESPMLVGQDKEESGLVVVNGIKKFYELLPLSQAKEVPTL